MSIPSEASAAAARELAARYIAAWNEADATRRAALVNATFAPDVSYQDPMMEGQGHDGIAALIAGVQQRFAGCRFALEGTPDAHHGVLRFSWALALPDAAPVARGTDMAVLDGAGRLRQVTGFLDYLAG
ncbi:MAG: nuclear transport factor 2 family protein [Pseudomonadota bacterium]